MITRLTHQDEVETPPAVYMLITLLLELYLVVVVVDVVVALLFLLMSPPIPSAICFSARNPLEPPSPP